MRVLESLKDLRRWRRGDVCLGKDVGFVPTMGALHAGHESLIKEARTKCDIVVVSIFVNPTQFNDPEDCLTYPKPEKADLALCAELGVDAVFLPSRELIYPDDYRFRVCENAFSTVMEGAFRPGHFDGVLTVVLKLFQLVQADRAFFGEKDWQQLSLVRDMAAAFFVATEVIGCPTVREPSGLALSSRNVRLSEAARKKAPTFYRLLVEEPRTEAVRAGLEAAGFEVEYVEEADGRRLGAVVIEGVRLIDNVPLTEVGSKMKTGDVSA